MSETTITIGPVYFSFPHLFRPSKVKGSDKEQYSLAVLWDANTKDGKKITAAVNAAVAAAEDAGQSKLEKTPLKKQRRPLKDAEEEKPEDKNYAGRMLINCNNTRQPDVVNKKMEAVINDDDVYPGCVGFVQINFFAYNQGGGVGIGASLQNVMVTGNDQDKYPAWASTKQSAEEAFKGVTFSDDDDDDVPLPKTNMKPTVVDDDDDILPPKRKVSSFE